MLPGAQAFAQNAPSGGDSTSVDDEVLVRGQRMSDIEFDLQSYVLDFVGQVAKLPQGGSYARWDDRVCVSVNNLERNAAQFVIDEISLLAADLGLQPGEPGCTPNVIIVFTTDANGLASHMVETEPLLFRPVRAVCCMHLGAEALEDFAETDRAVRWWHVSVPVEALSGRRAVRLPQDHQVPVNSVAGPSRIHSGIRYNLYRVVIIVDNTKLEDTTWRQIADYLAFVSMAQTDPNAAPAAYDSILNLLENPAATAGLTDWDRSYLRALYSTNPERTPEHHKNALVSQMASQDLRGDE